MDIKILDKPSYNFDNSALEKLIADYTNSDHTMEKLKELVDAFRKVDVIVPVAFPKQVDPEVLKKMMTGQPLKKSEGIQMLPITFSDKDGNKFAPAFTSRSMITDAKDFPFMIRVRAEAVIKTATNEQLGLTGVLLNPQTKGFMFRKQAFTDDLDQIITTQKEQAAQGGQQQIKKVSKQEFELLARNTVEKNHIPKALFEQKAEFIKELDEKREQLIFEMYSRPYGDKLPSPYTIEDFSMMVLDIDDETTAFCIELPQKPMMPSLALSAYIIWNPVKEQGYYYMIEKGQQGQENVLCNMTPDGKHYEQMTAPPVGSELSSVLELIREDEEE